jgi:probable HAF family extracellular repeat protein
MAVGINESGQIIGESYTSLTPSQYCGEKLELPLATGAFLWQNGQMQDLGNFGGTCTFASHINNHGQVVGLSTLAGDVAQHAFLWENGVMQDLGTFGGDMSSAIKVSDTGDAVGYATFPGNEIFHAFVWSRGQLTDIGTLDGDSLSSAFDVNERGQVIGISIAEDGTFRPFLWERGGPMIDLNAFVPPGSNLRLENVANINDRGEIAVVGRIGTGEQRDFVLIPCGDNEANGCQEATPVSVVRPMQGPNPSVKTGRLSAAEFMRLMRPRSIFGNFGRNRGAQHTNAAPSAVYVQSISQPEAGVKPSATSTLSCVYTGTYGLKICSPTAGSTVTSPIHVVADASGNFNQMTVNIDGGQTYFANAIHADVYLSATVGPHTVRVCALMVASVSRGVCSSVSVTVVATSSCSAPASAGVHVCAPANGSTVASPVHTLARGLVSGTFARMELWVDGVKKFNSPTTLLDAYPTLGAGSHRFNFRAVNTAGTIWSKVVYATVK